MTSLGSIPAASGIVLAGGRSSRFGSDKLTATFRGQRLVDLALLALAEVTSEIVVVTAMSGEPPVSPESRARVPVRTIRDPEPFGGPLVALSAGLEHVREPLAVVAGGDMPTLVPAVLAAMLRALEASAGELVTLEYRGRPQPLPLALRVGATLPRAQRLVGSAERTLRALLTGAGTVRLPEADWRAHDPSATTLRDVDRPEDLLR